MVISMIRKRFFCEQKNRLLSEDELFDFLLDDGVYRKDFIFFLERFPFLENYLVEFFGLCSKYNFHHERFKNPDEKFDIPLGYQILKVSNILTYLLFIHKNEYEKVLIDIFGEDGNYFDSSVKLATFWDRKQKELERFEKRKDSESFQELVLKRVSY